MAPPLRKGRTGGVSYVVGLQRLGLGNSPNENQDDSGWIQFFHSPWRVNPAQ